MGEFRHERSWTLTAQRFTGILWQGMLRAPKNPGTYEVVYILQGAQGRRALTRKTIEIKASP